MDFMDLHVHSHYSDGVNSPIENIELAKKIGLKAVTLSDHDTVKGISEAEAKAKELDIEFVKGIEISTFHDDCKSIHMLGLMWVDETPFYSVEEMVAKSRNIRNVEIYKKLKELYGYEIDLKEMKSYSKSTIIGRGHLSRALVDKGYAKNFHEADNIIKTAKVSMSYGVNIEDAIKSVHSAKGLAIMAHPCSLKKEYIADEEYDATFGKSVNESKIITARNIKTAKDEEEKIFFIFKSFVDFEYRYLMAYPLFCSEHGVDLLPFMNKFEKNNEEIIAKMETISASNKKIMEYKEKLYMDNNLKDFLNQSISEEFRDITSLPFSDICASFNASIHNEKTHNYSQVFPEFAEFIIRYTQNPETLMLNTPETKE